MKKLALVLIGAAFAASAMADDVPKAPVPAPAPPAKAAAADIKVKGNKTAAEDAATMKDAKDKTKKCIPMPDCLKNKPK